MSILYYTLRCNSWHTSIAVLCKQRARDTRHAPRSKFIKHLGRLPLVASQSRRGWWTGTVHTRTHTLHNQSSPQRFVRVRTAVRHAERSRVTEAHVHARIKVNWNGFVTLYAHVTQSYTNHTNIYAGCVCVRACDLYICIFTLTLTYAAIKHPSLRSFSASRVRANRCYHKTLLMEC